MLETQLSRCEYFIPLLTGIMENNFSSSPGNRESPGSEVRGQSGLQVSCLLCSLRPSGVASPAAGGGPRAAYSPPVFRAPPAGGAAAAAARSGAAPGQQEAAAAADAAAAAAGLRPAVGEELLVLMESGAAFGSEPVPLLVRNLNVLIRQLVFWCRGDHHEN